MECMPSKQNPQDLLGVPSYEDLCRAPTLTGGQFPLIPMDNPTSAFVQDLLTKVCRPLCAVHAALCCTVLCTLCRAHSAMLYSVLCMQLYAVLWTCCCAVRPCNTMLCCGHATVQCMPYVHAVLCRIVDMLLCHACCTNMQHHAVLCRARSTCTQYCAVMCCAVILLAVVIGHDAAY